MSLGANDVRKLGVVFGVNLATSSLDGSDLLLEDRVELAFRDTIAEEDGAL